MDPSQKKHFTSNHIFWVEMGQGMGYLGQRGPKHPQNWPGGVKQSWFFGGWSLQQARILLLYPNPPEAQPVYITLL